MTRLQTLIKEVLSQPKKKDCGCGCNDCGGKAPILTEGKVKHLISEGIQYHMDKKIQLHESVYRIGSEKHFELIREARALWVRGIINVSEDDQAILETNLGHFGMYEGEAVPLDMPMLNENQDYDVVSTKNLDAYIYKDGGIKLLIGGWFVCSEACTGFDAVHALYKQLEITDKEFPGLPWVAVIRKSNQFVVSLNKRFGFKIMDKNHSLFKIAKKCFS